MVVALLSPFFVVTNSASLQWHRLHSTAIPSVVLKTYGESVAYSIFNTRLAHWRFSVSCCLNTGLDPNLYRTLHSDGKLWHQRQPTLPWVPEVFLAWRMEMETAQEKPLAPRVSRPVPLPESPATISSRALGAVLAPLFIFFPVTSCKTGSVSTPLHIKRISSASKSLSSLWRWMIRPPTKHCFEKCNKNHKSPCLLKDVRTQKLPTYRFFKTLTAGRKW